MDSGIKDMFEGKWQGIKGRIRQQWGKLTDDDVAQSEGNWEELSGRVEKTYGYTKDQARDEVTRFKDSLRN